MPKDTPAKLKKPPIEHKVLDDQDWKHSWQNIEDEFVATTLDNFRQNTKITNRISGSNKRVKRWWETCLDENILPEHYSDTLIGNPKDSTILGGVPVTRNSLRHAYYIKRIKEYFPVEAASINVLEIGAGYGGMAEQLCRQFDIAKMYLLDNPAMQRLQEYYLTKTGHVDKLCFEEPSEKASIDLIIATHTLCEIPVPEVAEYIKLFELVIKPTGLLYIAQREATGSHIFSVLSEYPFDDNWEFTTFEFYPSPKFFIECFGTRLA